jgi:hypothetical protein
MKAVIVDEDVLSDPPFWLEVVLFMGAPYAGVTPCVRVVGISILLDPLFWLEVVLFCGAP